MLSANPSVSFVQFIAIKGILNMFIILLVGLFVNTMLVY